MSERSTVRTETDRPVRWTVSGVAVAAVLIAICVAVGLSAALPGNPLAAFAGREPGPIVSLGLPAMRALFDLSGALTVGWLIGAVFLAPPERTGRFSVGGYRCAQAASLAALVWFFAALAMIPLSYAYAAGQSIGDALSADGLLIGVRFFDSSEAALKAAVLVALVGIFARAVMRPASAFAVLLLSIAALLPIALAGHASGSEDHDLASDTMIFHLVGISIWVGGLVAFLGLARQQVDHLDVIARRYSATALIAFIAVAVSGIGNAWLRVASLGYLFTTDYGRLVLVKAGLLVLLGGFGYLQRTRSVRDLQTGNRRALLRLAVYEIGVMATTIGVAVALGRTAPPPASPVVPTDLQLELGFNLDGPPTPWVLLTDWRFDLIFGTAALVFAGLYAWGLVRLHRAGIGWSRARSIAWFSGCGVLLVATSSGIGRYAVAQFSVHMMSHMLLGMVVPILLVLGAPTTLALRSLSASRGDGVPGAREALVGLTKSRVLNWLTQPLIIFPLFVGSFFAIYFTSLFDAMISSHMGHVLMNAHFLMVGYLYYWVIIGIDPSPRRLQPLVKLGLLVGALPFHAFFGLALMNSRSVIGQAYYSQLQLPWVPNLLTDQHLGGGLAWGGAELPLVVVLIAMLSQWSNRDEREARRADRKAELDDNSDLAAYNAMLGKLAQRDQGSR